ncbi:MAG: ATP-binding protein [Alphaproteobacteria bacterium]
MISRIAATMKSLSQSPGAPTTPPKKFWKVARRWENRVAALLMVLAVLGGIATYAALKEVPPLGNDPDTVIWLLNIDLIILVMLVGLIARRLVSVWSGRKRGIAGSHLHVRLVYIFSLIAAAPVIVMTIFSALFFHFGVQTWFSERVATAVNESQAVAEAYLDEHTQAIRADTLAMAGDIDRQGNFLSDNEAAFEKTIQTQSFLRNLSEAIVFDTTGRVLVRSGLTFSLEFEDIPQYAMQQAGEGDVVVMMGAGGDRVRALIKLNSLSDTFLYVGRMVDPQVLSHVSSTRRASEDYASLQSRYSDFQVTVTMIFVLVGLVLVMAATWLGLILARQLVQPIGTLISAADRVRAGDLTTRVPQEGGLQEFDYLAHAFNRMTKQIDEQQNELLEANRQMDRRRRFTETVLTGVSSGVLGLDARGIVTLANSSAHSLLEFDKKDLVGLPAGDIIPGMEDLLKKAHERSGKITQGQLSLAQKNKPKRDFLVRIGIETLNEQEIGAVVTFDDITELQSAQRKAAWADVARRIAHEIKNPLTPIQLSAERLRRKYLSQIKDDPETFSQCIETIIRHVADIERMVSEFSSFARMPEPVMKQENLEKHVRETLVLHRQAHPDIEFNFTALESPTAAYDAQQIRQAINNLIQNSVDAIHGRIEKDEDRRSGRINVLMTSYGRDEIAIVITDNGAGLPDVENPVQLAEPYVTHKLKGTGLGLAIVKKIMEDHKGNLLIGAPEWLASVKEWQDLGGATLALVMPADRIPAASGQEAA